MEKVDHMAVYSSHHSMTKGCGTSLTETPDSTRIVFVSLGSGINHSRHETGVAYTTPVAGINMS